MSKNSAGTTWEQLSCFEMSVPATTDGQITPIMTTWTSPIAMTHTPVLTGLTGILPYSAYSTPSTPTPNSTIRGQKRKEKENLLPAPSSKRAKLDLTDLEKLRMFYGFLKEELGWTYGEAIYKTSIALADHNKSHKATIQVHPLAKRPELKYHATDNQIISTMQHFFAGKGDYTPAKVVSSWYLQIQTP
jgi:hypothetical protein